MDDLLPTARLRRAQNTTASPVKLGVVYLGALCHKRKYMLLDASDIPFVRQFSFLAKCVYQPDGNGAQIVAHAIRNDQDPSTGEQVSGLFHELLWQYHRGRIPSGYSVAHRNGVTVDNRLKNLELVSTEKGVRGTWAALTERERDLRVSEANLYRVALNQLPPFPDDHVSQRAASLVPNRDGELISITLASAGDTTVVGAADEWLFVECHALACCAFESQTVEFQACPECHHVRYCSDRCQKLDATLHAPECDRFKRRNTLSSIKDDSFVR